MIIEIKNLNYQNIFKDLNLNIKEGDFTFISGKTSSGKTLLLKMILGLIDTDIKLFNMDLKSNLNEVRKNIGIVFENPENYFIADTVKEEISFILENLKFKKTEINKRVDEISDSLNINHLLSLNPHSLSGGEKELVALASALINKPRLLLIDGSLSMLDEVTKDKVFSYLKKLNAKEKLTILSTTNNLEDSLYGKELILLDKNIILKEKINKAFDNEEIFKKCNLEMPFMASLSHKLKYYGLVDKVILNMDKMVNELWK